MSIMQDFEEARKMIGPEKYDAIEQYLDEVCPRSNYDKYNKELNTMLDYSTDEWLKKKAELEEKYGIIFLSDVLYKPEEWEKFEKWYENNINKEQESEEEEIRVFQKIMKKSKIVSELENIKELKII